ncbi:MAG: hypothetical protein ACU0DT_17775 [Albimonas sp.]|uniref:hypothetical protein n=1 Tax=Albimonas sp. TaxID=1872425 RepID=UPI004055B4D6|tara:strand:+ start:1085 stop:1492 length:408 start_codon:yes stop_codon:yes gene_type:complete
MTEDWTGLTDAERAEKLAEALATIERRSTPHMTSPDRVCDCSFCSSAFAASILASYRASLEAAPVLDAEAGEDGWIPWEGGKCPVPPETVVDIKCRADAGPGPTAVSLADHSFWGRGPHPDASDIIAYRLYKEPR